MKKKIVTLCLAAALAVTAIGGTLAYFTDTEKATNTMTIGNVDIDIDELAYDHETGEWSDFEDDKFVLYPQKKEDGMLNYNKMVYTWNNSKHEQAAYIRSIILVEVPRDEKGNRIDQIAFAFSSEVERTGYVADVKIGDVYYDAYAYTAVDKQPIASGDKLQSLSSVRFTEDTTQELAALYGGKVDIIAFSQAVQAEDLTHEEAMAALGELTVADLQKWVGDADEATINDHWNFN